jgi:hypothetical protein
MVPVLLLRQINLYRGFKMKLFKTYKKKGRDSHRALSEASV